MVAACAICCGWWHLWPSFPAGTTDVSMSRILRWSPRPPPLRARGAGDLLAPYEVPKPRCESSEADQMVCAARGLSGRYVPQPRWPGEVRREGCGRLGRLELPLKKVQVDCGSDHKVNVAATVFEKMYAVS